MTPFVFEKDRVLFWSLLCFLFGAGAGLWFPLSTFVLVLLTSVGCALAFIFQEKRYFFFLLFYLCFFLGEFLSVHSFQSFEHLTPEVEASGIFRLVTEAEEKNTHRESELYLVSCETFSCPRKNILWKMPLSLDVTLGDRIRLTCVFRRPENFNEDFNYRMYLAMNDIGYVCEQGSIQILPKDRVGTLSLLLIWPKKALEHVLTQTLPEPEAGLAKGLLLGGSNYLSGELKEKFSRVGLTHMIAVSGYNITLVAQGLLLVGLFFGLWRKQALWASLLGIAFFIVMIGAPASAVRAGLMAGVIFSALQVGRMTRPLNALLLAAVLMVMMRPLILRYDIGFQLSFLATLALVTLFPFFDTFLSKEGWRKYIFEVIGMTLAVEFFILPILLFSFHAFSPLILVGNFLLLLVPLAMFFSFFEAVLFLIFPGSHLFLSWLAYIFLTLITRSVEWLGEKEWSSFTFSHFGERELVLWYVFLGIIVAILKKYYAKKRYATQ